MPSSASRHFSKLWKRTQTQKTAASYSEVLVEDYIPGIEVALEGILLEGELKTLALFDKPDPLEGPFFEETLYITPSRLSSEVQDALQSATAEAAAALGLRHGPIHAELRYNAKGAHLIEIAARTIGGLCSRTLRFGTGMSLEELVIRHAIGQHVEMLHREQQAAGGDDDTCSEGGNIGRSAWQVRSARSRGCYGSQHHDPYWR